MKVFSSRYYLPQQTYPAPLLYPLWEDLYSSQLYGWTSPYDEYVAAGCPFEPSELSQADVAVLPFDWKEVRGDSWHRRPNLQLEALAIEFSQNVASATKPLAIFFGSDCSDERIKISRAKMSGAKIFRQSSYRSRAHLDSDPVFPFFCEDFVQVYAQGELVLRPKRSRPRVGFCGFARPVNLKRRLQTWAYRSYMLAAQGQSYRSPYVGEALRIRALQTLRQSPHIETEFIVRDRSVFFTASDYREKQRVRQEYVNNLFESDYVLCCRGSGNYSNRLYEVLSCGRIPVFINTDCRLPWEDLINWKDYCVWVEEDEIDAIADKVAAFHSQLSSEEFIALQQRCRQLWLDWLSPQGYFSNFHRFFESAGQPELLMPV